MKVPCAEFSPVYGTESTAEHGQTWDQPAATLCAMNKPRKPKTPKVPGVMRAVLAENVRALLAYRFELVGDKVRALASSSGVAKSTIHRILKCEVGATIDAIEQLALALDVSVYQLLTPNLDAKHPQVVQGASVAERQLYARLATQK